MTVKGKLTSALAITGRWILAVLQWEHLAKFLWALTLVICAILAYYTFSHGPAGWGYQHVH